MYNPWIRSAVGAALVVSVWSCGGGSGGGNGRPPVASEPTCGLAAPQTKPPAIAQIGGGAPNVWIPPTSVERAADIGVRAHTNHLIRADSIGNHTRAIGGYYPSQIAGAYGAMPNGGSGAIAIVDAFHYPNALNDFNVFSSQFGLPTEPSASATATSNQVLQVVYATGSQPSTDGGWAQEMALDIEWAHAMAPNAKIYLVEAASSNLSDLALAVNVAKALPNVTQVSMSFGSTEDGCSYVTYNNALLRSGVTFFAAAGDASSDRLFPALSYNVVSVGGTSLNVNALGVWQSESVWVSTGCGPSTKEPRPVFQDPLYPTIGLYRAGCDIVAVGDPATGVAVYDSLVFQGVSGWFVVGGTSASCPIVAGIVNNAGVAAASSQALNAKFYGAIGSGHFHDITSGTSGSFSAHAGWDYPSGVGSPNGLNGL